jgi:hypothetical protein
MNETKNHNGLKKKKIPADLQIQVSLKLTRIWAILLVDRHDETSSLFSFKTHPKIEVRFV